MVKYFCDRCKKETPLDKLNEFKYLVHIEQMYKGNVSGYTDSELNHISARHKTKILCNKCYNEIMIVAYKEFIKGE